MADPMTKERIAALREWNRGGADEMDEALDEIERLCGEAQRLREHSKLLEHKVITCGVAASHPNANLSRTGAYAEKWDSPQAEDVRQLRAEIERLRGALRHILDFPRRDSDDKVVSAEAIAYAALEGTK